MMSYLQPSICDKLKLRFTMLSHTYQQAYKQKSWLDWVWHLMHSNSPLLLALQSHNDYKHKNHQFFHHDLSMLPNTACKENIQNNHH